MILAKWEFFVILNLSMSFCMFFWHWLYIAVPYPPLPYSEQKCAHSCSEWSIVRYGTGAFWDLWITGVFMGFNNHHGMYLRTPCGHFNLTLWGWVTHICVSELTNIGSDNGLSPDRHQANIWTNAGILLIGPLGTNLSEILIEIWTFPSKKMYLKVSSAKQRPFFLGLNVLKMSY